MNLSVIFLLNNSQKLYLLMELGIKELDCAIASQKICSMPLTFCSFCITFVL
ncbi:hypothetical protein FDUTEX481_07648 [Tolypothrix sp. PCC 7601]|nr:hypothetical protein FDUTEX481_07648 [Tolypothrix sp. PCC 7601]